MQKEAFAQLYAKYQDTKTSPATEEYEDILFRFNQPETTYYFITAESVKEGVIRIVDCKDGVTRKEYRRSSLCRNTAIKATLSRQSQKRRGFTARITGSSTQSCRKKATAICMKNSAIIRPA